jgi:hypothetical protein
LPGQEKDEIRFLEECLKKEPRTYKSRQLTEKEERKAAKGVASLMLN